MINAWASGPEQMACVKSLTCVQDRLRLREALGVATTVSGIVVIHRLPQHRRGVGSLLDCGHWAHTSTD
jgi:hypothetical protein